MVFRSVAMQTGTVTGEADGLRPYGYMVIASISKIKMLNTVCYIDDGWTGILIFLLLQHSN